MLILVSLAVALLGALVYLLVERPTIKELGRMAFFAGLLVCLLQLQPSVIGIGVK